MSSLRLALKQSLQESGHMATAKKKRPRSRSYDSEDSEEEEEDDVIVAPTRRKKPKIPSIKSKKRGRPPKKRTITPQSSSSASPPQHIQHDGGGNDSDDHGDYSSSENEFSGDGDADIDGDSDGDDGDGDGDGDADGDGDGDGDSYDEIDSKRDRHRHRHRQKHHHHHDADHASSNSNSTSNSVLHGHSSNASSDASHNGDADTTIRQRKLKKKHKAANRIQKEWKKSKYKMKTEPSSPKSGSGNSTESDANTDDQDDQDKEKTHTATSPTTPQIPAAAANSSLAPSLQTTQDESNAGNIIKKRKKEKRKSGGSTGKSKTVPPPVSEVLVWSRNLPVKRARKNVVAGLRVKVRFATKVKREGKVLRKKKWFGGRVSAVSKEGSKIRIKYDDGTSEVSKFPDKDVVVDDDYNGEHQANATKFLPPEPEPEAEYDDVDEELLEAHIDQRVAEDEIDDHNPESHEQNKKKVKQRLEQYVKEKAMKNEQVIGMDNISEKYDVIKQETRDLRAQDDAKEITLKNSDEDNISLGEDNSREVDIKSGKEILHGHVLLQTTNEVEEDKTHNNKPSEHVIQPKREDKHSKEIPTDKKSEIIETAPIIEHPQVSKIELRISKGEESISEIRKEEDEEVVESKKSAQTLPSHTKNVNKRELAKSMIHDIHNESKAVANNDELSELTRANNTGEDSTLGVAKQNRHDNPPLDKNKIDFSKISTDVMKEEHGIASKSVGIKETTDTPYQHKSSESDESTTQKQYQHETSSDSTSVDHTVTKESKAQHENGKSSSKPTLTIRIPNVKKDEVDSSEQRDETKVESKASSQQSSSDSAELDLQKLPIFSGRTPQKLIVFSKKRPETEMLSRDAQNTKKSDVHGHCIEEPKDSEQTASVENRRVISLKRQRSAASESSGSVQDGSFDRKMHDNEFSSVNSSNIQETSISVRQDGDQGTVLSDKGKIQGQEEGLQDVFRQANQKTETSSQSSILNQSSGDSEPKPPVPKKINLQAEKTISDESRVLRNEKVKKGLGISKHSAFVKKDLNSEPQIEEKMRPSTPLDVIVEEGSKTEQVLTPSRDRSSNSLPAVRSGRRAAQQANERIVSKQESVVQDVVGKKRKRRDKVDGRSRDSDGEENSQNSQSAIENDKNWVQCDKCGKWRIIPNHVKVSSLPKHWYCENNIYDLKRNSCDAPEQSLKQISNKEKKKGKKRMRHRAEASLDSTGEEISRKEPSRAEGGKERYGERPRSPPIQGEVNARDAKRAQAESTQKSKRASPNSIPSVTENSAGSEPVADSQTRNDKKTPGKKRTLQQEVLDATTSLDEGLLLDGKAKNKGRGKNRKEGKEASKKEVERATIAANATSTPSQQQQKEKDKEKKDDADNLEWVQCEKCDKWRRLPSHISAGELPDVWYCSLNTWNPASASCDSPEDKADGLQDIGGICGNAPSHTSSGKLSYRSLIFGSGRKLNRPVSERTRAAESLFAAPPSDELEVTYPTVMYANSSAFVSRNPRMNFIEENNNNSTSIFELMSHSNLWAELRGSNERMNFCAPSSIFGNHYQPKYCYDAMPLTVKQAVKDLVFFSLGSGALTGDEVRRQVQRCDLQKAPAAWSDVRRHCDIDMVISALCELVSEDKIEVMPTGGPDCAMTDWNPRYRRVLKCSVKSTPRRSRCMKIAKPWKQTRSQPRNKLIR